MGSSKQSKDHCHVEVIAPYSPDIISLGHYLTVNLPPRGGIHDSTKTPWKWRGARDSDKDHISILASTPEEFDQFKMSPFHLFTVDPKAPVLEFESSIEGDGLRSLSEKEITALREAETTFTPFSELGDGNDDEK